MLAHPDRLGGNEYNKIGIHADAGLTCGCSAYIFKRCDQSMNVVGYVRVSTDRQVEDGLGIDLQTQAIEAWTRSHEHNMSGLWTDKGVSGAKELDIAPH